MSSRLVLSAEFLDGPSSRSIQRPLNHGSDASTSRQAVGVRVDCALTLSAPPGPLTASVCLWLSFGGSDRHPADDNTALIHAAIERARRRGPASFVLDTMTAISSPTSLWTCATCVLTPRLDDATQQLWNQPIVAQRRSSAYDVGGGGARGSVCGATPSKGVCRTLQGTAVVPSAFVKRHGDGGGAAMCLVMGLVLLHHESASSVPLFTSSIKKNNNSDSSDYVRVMVNEFSSDHLIFVQPLVCSRPVGNVEGCGGGGGTPKHRVHSATANSSTPQPHDSSSLTTSSLALAKKVSRQRSFVGGGGAAAAAPLAPLEHHPLHYLVRCFSSADHCVKLQERFHILVASSTMHKCCSSVAARLLVPIELYGGMYSAKTQWFISALADSMLLTKVFLKQGGGGDAGASAGVTPAAAAAGHSLDYFLEPKGIIDVLLRCCRSPNELLCSRFRHYLDEKLLYGEMGAMGATVSAAAAVADTPSGKKSNSDPHAQSFGGKLVQSVSSNYASSVSSDSPRHRRQHHHSPRAGSAGDDRDGAVNHDDENGEGDDLASPSGGSSDRITATHFSVEWHDFALLVTVGRAGWERILFPLIDRYYTFPPLQEAVRRCSYFHHASVEQVREHLLWVATALQPSNSRREDFQAFLDRCFPVWSPSFSSSGSPAASQRSLRRGSQSTFLLPVTALSSLPPWLTVFIRPTGRSAAKLGVLSLREWVDELHVTPSRVLWALMPLSQSQYLVNTTLRSNVLLTTEKRASRNARMLHTYVNALRSKLQHILLSRYHHRWLLHHRHRREFLRKRAALVGALQRKTESRLLGSYFHTWKLCVDVGTNGLRATVSGGGVSGGGFIFPHRGALPPPPSPFSAGKHNKGGRVQ